MKRTENIIEMVADGVRNQLERQIAAGAKDVHYEQLFGTAYVDVYYTPYAVTVVVSHIDTKHRSPMLESEIVNVLPDWNEVADTIFWEDSKQTA
jgi:hypothetical protein